MEDYVDKSSEGEIKENGGAGESSEQVREELPKEPINMCRNCGAELADGQEFCPKCGQKVNAPVDIGFNPAFDQPTAGVENKKKKSKVAIVTAVAVLVFIITIAAIISKTVSAKARESYILNVQEFLTLSTTAGENLEDIADTVREYWYQNIYNDKYGSSINTAIAYALYEKSEEITQAEEYDTQLKALYSRIKNVPGNIPAEDVNEIEELCEAVKELYNTYTDFYDFATDPSGNFNTYTDNKNEFTNEFESCKRAVENLIN